MRITTIGEILIDMTQTHVDGNLVTHFAANPGGAPLNVAVAAARLGCETAFVGCVGDDIFGRQLRETVLRSGVDASGLQVTDKAATTLAIVTVDPKGERDFSFCRKPGADTCIDADAAVEAVRGTDILHFGSVSLTDPGSREVTLGAVRAARETGAIITYDPNYRAPLWESEGVAMEQMRAPLPLCDIVKISDEETVLLTGEQDPDAAAKALLALGVKLVVVTLGSRGALWACGDMENTVPGFRVQVADTNGAGDTFFGALLSKIAGRGGIRDLTREELDAYVRFANRAASLTASRPGAIPAMPTFQEVNGEE